MFKRTKISSCALLALGGVAALAALPTLAQTSQRIEITGSSIKRIDAETAAPVLTVTREDIAKSGKSSVAELLQTLSVDNQGSVPMSFGNGFASGASGISLRGLGAASTLVLVNGRRIAPYGLADDGQKVFADLNVIPLEAVDRVEILKDGASAIYGSDAIAGVVNVILRKDFSGVVFKAGIGQSRYGDGTTKTAAMTLGHGDLQRDKFNILLNVEVNEKNPIWNKDRAGRGAVGRADLRDLGFDAQAALGGTGAILSNNLAASAINGNVRNPTTLDYYNRGDLAGVGFTRTFPGAACSNFTNHPQGDPGYNLNVDANGDPILPFIQSGRGCLIDGPQVYGQILPSQTTFNAFVRGAAMLGSNTQAYLELGLYSSESVSATTPSGVSGSTGFPGGPVPNNTIALGAAHPDNPYFGTAARLRYLAADVGPRVSNVSSEFTRIVAGVKGTFGEWDYDTAFLYSTTKVSNSRTGYLQRDATYALLNPTGTNLQAGVANSVRAAVTNAAYAALPAGTLWRIAENAGLNSAAVYKALSPTISNDANAKTTQIDFKASRDLMQLGGGALAMAVGAEVRKESVSLDPTQGTERGNIIGLGYSAYNGSRDLTAGFVELLAPITKSFEANAALRVDHYSDVGNSTTPKLGLKWTPMSQLALRGTYSQGFRAPSPAENGKGGLAAFTTATDPVRCTLGVASACNPGNVAIITSPNPALKPEKSKAVTLGLVFDPIPGTSVSFDLWQIKRSNEINQETSAAAIAAGHVSRDPLSATAIPGDPGPIIAVLTNYVNSSSSVVRGYDLDARHTMSLGGAGKLAFDVKWTHLLTLKRTDPDGSSFDFAGTHGNCDVTNCIGTPANRANFGISYETGPWRLATIINYRGEMKNTNFKNDPDGCAVHFADGSDAPAGCKIKSFSTVDLTGRWQATPQLEVYGSIQNLFDTKPPLDPLTYGAVSYNPLDFSGAIGRFFSVGLKYKF